VRLLRNALSSLLRYDDTDRLWIFTSLARSGPMKLAFGSDEGTNFELNSETRFLFEQNLT
jgi:hypothetical protein